jgi:hypothetical protein
MSGNLSQRTGASDCIRKHFNLTDQEVTKRAPSRSSNVDHKRPTVASRKGERPAAKTGERRRGEKRQQEQQRETRDGTTADQHKTVQTSAEAKKKYLAIMSKPAEELLSRFVQVLLRLPLRPRLQGQGESMCNSRKPQEQRQNITPGCR